jgi:hypothetical protein
MRKKAGPAPTGGYPDTVDLEGISQKDFLRYTGDANNKGPNNYYGFWVINVASKRLVDSIYLYPNPQSIQMSEPAASTIQAMQGGGKYLERRGNLFKDITVSGTTGYMPYKRAIAQSREFDQRFRFHENEEVAGHLFPVSGYAKFHELRNFYRGYQNQLRTESRDVASNLRFVWVNHKDEEYFVVEPLDFRTTRDKSKPLNYEYSIPMKFIEVLDKALVDWNDPILPTTTKFGKVLAGIAAARKWLAKVARLINQVKALINTMVAAVRAVVETALHLMDSVYAAVDSFVNATLDAVQLPQSVVVATARAWAQVLDVAYEIGFTLTTETVAAVLDLRQSCNIFAAETDLFKSSMTDGYTKLLARFPAPEGTIRGSESEAADITSAGSSQVTTQSFVLLFGETLQMFAARVLGDAARFLEIVVLNNFMAPYVSPNDSERLPNTCCPGDAVKCPSQATSPEKQQAVQPPDEPPGSKPDTQVGQATDGTFDLLVADLTALLEGWLIDRWKGFVCEFLSGTGAGQVALIASNTENVLTFQTPLAVPADRSTIYVIRPVTRTTVTNPALAALGIDIALTQDKDLAKVATGDLQKIRGFANVQQAVDSKFGTEQGTLVAHNFFGIKAQPGRRADQQSLAELSVNARRTLLSDPRIRAIRRLSYSAVKDVVNFTGEIELSMGGVTQTISGAT